jgi:hypothetical protein
MRMDYLAAHFLKEIRAVQPVRTYHLLEYSFGGLMALEIAQHLRAAGESLAFLGMLDTRHTGHLRSLYSEQTVQQRLAKTNRLRVLRAKSMLSSPIGGVGSQARRAWIAHGDDLTGLILRSAYTVCGALGLGCPNVARGRQGYQWVSQMRYSVRPCSGTITLVRADQGIAPRKTVTARNSAGAPLAKEQVPRILRLIPIFVMRFPPSEGNYGAYSPTDSH